MAVLAVKAAPEAWLAYGLCLRALALLEAQMSTIQKLKALKKCQAVVGFSERWYYIACWSASRAH